MKRLVILGSTGNIGTQTLEVVDKYPKKFRIIGLSINNNIKLLLTQIKKYRPLAVGVADEKMAEILQKQTKIKVYSGTNASMQITKIRRYDTLVNCLVGLSGIKVTLEAIKLRKNIALANKETLVSAGEIVMREIKKYKTKLMPIDSEHSALFQCLRGEKKSDIHRLIITCSGGALRDKTKNELKGVTTKDALGHKTWTMGAKITIDSATLMNKGFEVIEAMWLYNIPVEKIEVVIHPQSIIHSMIEYSDGSIMAQLCNPDMKLPIQYALSYPERWDAPLKRFKFNRDLTFAKPDLSRFPALGYALKAAKTLGTMPAAMNATNDFLVNKFLSKKCNYLDIQNVIKKVMDKHQVIKKPNINDIEKAISESTKLSEKYLKEIK